MQYFICVYVTFSKSSRKKRNFERVRAGTGLRRTRFWMNVEFQSLTTPVLILTLNPPLKAKYLKPKVAKITRAGVLIAAIKIALVGR